MPRFRQCPALNDQRRRRARKTPNAHRQSTGALRSKETAAGKNGVPQTRRTVSETLQAGVMPAVMNEWLNQQETRY